MASVILSRDDAPSIPLEEFTAWVKGTQIQTYMQSILVTLVVYDSLCTMDKEVKYFWTIRNFNFTRIVFFLNRYGGIFGACAAFLWNAWNPSQLGCDSGIWGQSFSRWLTIVSIDYVLMIRVLALFQNARWLSIVLRAFLGVEAVTKFILLVYSTKNEDIMVFELAPGLSSCATRQAPLMALAETDWTFPLAFGTVLLCLALFKAPSYWRGQGLKGSGLIITLLKDQVFYYVLAISCSLFSILNGLATTNHVVSSVLFGLGNPTLLCMLGSRMFFNLNEAAEHGVNAGTNWSSHIHSTMQFNAPQDLEKQEESGGGEARHDEA